MFTWKRFFLASAGLILVLLVLASLLLPAIIIEKAQQWVRAQTGRALAVEAVSINPFSLSVEIKNFRLSDSDQNQTFVSWKLLRVSLSMASLYHRAPVIDELYLDHPDIQLKRLTTDHYNFSDLIPQVDKKDAEQPAGEATRFSINNISIVAGQIDFIDNSLEKPVHHSIHDLNLVLPSIGNLSYMIDNPSQPLLRAIINDSPINLEGKLKPFSKAQEMQLDLELTDIDLPFYLGYLPIDLPVVLENGRLGLDLKLLYRISTETGGAFELSGKADLSSLRILDKQKNKLFFLPLLQVEISPSQPLLREIHLASIRAYNLEVQLKRNQQGEWNHAQMAVAEKTPATKAEAKDAAPAFKLLIDQVEVRDGILFFIDNFTEGGFKTVARAINIDVTDFALDAKEGIPFKLALQTDRDETITISGHFLLNPFTLALQTKLSALSLGAYEPYYREFYNQPFGGSLDMEASLLINPEQPLLISNGKIYLRDFYSAFNAGEGVGVGQFDINGLSFDMARNQLAIGRVSSGKAQAKFSRSEGGEWSFLSNNFPMLTKPAEVSAKSPAPQSASEEPPFSYHIGAVDISGWSIEILDQLPKDPARIKIDALSLNIDDLSAPEKVMSPFTLNMTLQHKGHVELKGSTSLADQETAVAILLSSVPLTTLAPYLAEQTNLVLTNGALNTRMNATATPAGKELQIRFSGHAGVSNFHVLDSLHQEDLLKWDSLQFDQIEGQLEPLQVSIGSITLNDYFAKVLIDEDARLNLAEAFNKHADSATAEEPQSIETEQTVATDIRIAKVVLQGGQVDFTDRSLPHPFHADMRELGGRIDGLSSAAGSRAEVDLRGSLRNQSPLNISGTINPLAEELFLDLKLSFRDIEMSPFSPYSGNFVGYMIEKGKLNLDLEYSIENNRLKAKNSVFLDQFTFGEAVESEQSTSLPVNLAVALLKDSKGEIHLDIPVSGSLDDPQFSVVGVVWKVLKNLLIKAATSPFALLGALVGDAEEDFSNVSFAYGSSRLSPAEQDKLKRMAEALAERPGLEVEVSGFIDPDNDAEGYRKEQLSMQVKRLKYLRLIKEGTLTEGISEEDVNVTAEEYVDYLWQVYRKADFPKPHNFVGMTKELPEAEMEKLIYANTQVTQDTLAELAQGRALAVQRFLIDKGQLAPNRIFLKKPDITAAPEQESVSRARVELGATVR